MNRVTSLAAFASLLLASPALAETTNCTNITALPATITVQGVYCLKQDLATNSPSGIAIAINTNNVTIDFNGFKLGGLGAGPNTQAYGVYAQDRQNITLRNGNIRGFNIGIVIVGTTLSSGHVIEDNLIDGSTALGISVTGAGLMIRRNRILNTDSTPPGNPSLAPVRAIDGAPLAELEIVPKGTTSQFGIAPMAGAGGPAWGIQATNLLNSEISDNLIAGVISPTQAIGVAFASSNNVSFARNTVMNVRSPQLVRGISTANSAGGRIAISDSVFLMGSSSTSQSVGLNAVNAIVSCSDNVVSGYTTPVAGCAAQQGTFPPP